MTPLQLLKSAMMITHDVVYSAISFPAISFPHAHPNHCLHYLNSLQDKSTMFTVRQQYVKPLEVIWAKCSSLGWGPHNTIHVDDLERNFELNKQSGVLISPFHLKPFTINPCDGLGESLLDGTVQSPPPIMSLSQGSSIDSNGLSEMDAETAENGPDITGGNGLVDSAYVRLRSSELSHSTVEEKEEQSSGPDASEGNRNKSFEDIELQLLAR